MRTVTEHPARPVNWVNEPSVAWATYVNEFRVCQVTSPNVHPPSSQAMRVNEVLSPQVNEWLVLQVKSSTVESHVS